MRQDQQTHPTEIWSRWFVLIAVALFAALVMIVAGELLAPSWRLGFEIAKAGVQFAVVIILGGLWAEVLRARERERTRAEKQREDQRRVDQYRLQVLLRDCIEAYNRIKGVRRALRALGLRKEMTRPLDAREVAEFHAQMGVLDDAQLSLERINRDIKSRRDVFHEPDSVLDQLSRAEHYVAAVVKVWEEHGDEIRVGSDASRLSTFSTLQDFLAPAARSNFKRELARPITVFEAAVRDELLPVGGRASSADPDS